MVQWWEPIKRYEVPDRTLEGSILEPFLLCILCYRSVIVTFILKVTFPNTFSQKIRVEGFENIETYQYPGCLCICYSLFIHSKLL